jgi:hypothetical protein
VPLSTLVRGFEDARGRFSVTERAATGDEAFIALFEVVAWIGSIGERLRNEEAPVPGVIQGLYYVRNAVVHNGAETLMQSTFPRPFGAGPFGAGVFGAGELAEWAWKPRNAFPPPISKAGATEYDSLLNGKAVRTTLVDVSEALASI